MPEIASRPRQRRTLRELLEMAELIGKPIEEVAGAYYRSENETPQRDNFWRDEMSRYAPRTETDIYAVPEQDYDKDGMPFSKPLPASARIARDDEGPGVVYTNRNRVVEPEKKITPDTLLQTILRGQAAGQKTGDIVNLRKQLVEEGKPAKRTAPEQKMSLLLKPIADKYGGQWDDTVSFEANVTAIAKSMDSERRASFINEVNSMLQHGGGTPQEEKERMKKRAATIEKIRSERNARIEEYAKRKDALVNKYRGEDDAKTGRPFHLLTPEEQEEKEVIKNSYNQELQALYADFPDLFDKRGKEIRQGKETSQAITKEQAIAELRRRGKI